MEPSTWSCETPRVSAAWISRPRVGEIENGDRVVVQARADGVLIVVVDALGHGPVAAKVAQTATDWVEANPAAVSVQDVTQGLHRALTASRGAAALSVTIKPDGIEACGVGNVDLRSMSGKLPFVLSPGVLGLRMRVARTCRVAAPLTDRFILYSDGISSRFDLKGNASLSAPAFAKLVFEKHRHEHDDSTVLVVDVTL